VFGDALKNFLPLDERQGSLRIVDVAAGTPEVLAAERCLVPITLRVSDTRFTLDPESRKNHSVPLNRQADRKTPGTRH
jgi:hypothetical protein